MFCHRLLNGSATFFRKWPPFPTYFYISWLCTLLPSSIYRVNHTIKLLMSLCFFFNYFVGRYSYRANSNAPGNGFVASSPFSWIFCRYEAVFYSALALVLMSWILFENTLLHPSAVKNLSPHTRNMEEHMILENDNRYLQLSDIRIPLTFVSFPPFLPSLSFSFLLSIMNDFPMNVLS